MVQPLAGDEHLGDDQIAAQRRVADLIHDSYGRLLAVLAVPTRDIAAAEDALADALERALVRWPEDGIPANPEAWLLTVARNRMRDMWKSHAYRMTDPLDETHDSPTEVDAMPAIPDRRLELMLVCAHPAIAANIRTPLMQSWQSSALSHPASSRASASTARRSESRVPAGKLRSS